MESILKKLGKRIKEERKKANLTQEKLAELVDLSTDYIGYIERGKQTPYLKTLELDKNQSLEFQEKEFVFIKRESGKYRLDGLPDFYQTAVQTQSQIQRDWAKNFKIIGFFEGAVNQIQDAVILKPLAASSR